jgi:hypothetical protein
MFTKRRQIDLRLGSVAAAVVALAMLGACGGSKGSTATSGEHEGLGDVKIKIHPASGPPGTKITWTAWGADCGRGTHKDVTLTTGSEIGPNQRDLVQRSTKKSSGTIIVPKATASGDYHVAIECARKTKLGFATATETAVTDVGFEVTDGG